MNVQALMNPRVKSAGTDASVADVVLLMEKHDCGAIPILNAARKLVGIVTDRDIALNVAADSKDSRSTAISEVMTPNPNTISSDEDIESALKIMSKGNIRRLPVTQNEKLVGLLSSADLAVELKKEFDQFISLEEAIAK